MLRDSPRTALQNTPKYEIDFGSLFNIEDLEQFDSVTADFYVTVISHTHGGRTIVRFEHGLPMVEITDSECSKSCGVVARGEDMGVGAIEEIDIQLAHAVHLVDAA